MKQALVSLIRTVVGGRSEGVAQQRGVLSELTVAEMRQVGGGPVEGPKGTW